MKGKGLLEIIGGILIAIGLFFPATKEERRYRRSNNSLGGLIGLIGLTLSLIGTLTHC